MQQSLFYVREARWSGGLTPVILRVIVWTCYMWLKMIMMRSFTSGRPSRRRRGLVNIFQMCFTPRTQTARFVPVTLDESQVWSNLFSVIFLSFTKTTRGWETLWRSDSPGDGSLSWTVIIRYRLLWDRLLLHEPVWHIGNEVSLFLICTYCQ